MQVIKKLITPAIFCLLVVAISIYFYAIPSLGIENIDERTNILIPIFFTSAGLIVTIILISIVNFIDLFLNYFKNRSIEKTRFIILNVLYFGFIFTCSMLCTLPIIIFLYSDLFILD
jgi:hypothetical protein